MEKLTRLYNELSSMGVSLFSGRYDFDGEYDALVATKGDLLGMFLDIDRIRTVQQELVAVGHEWAHIATGSTYTMGATPAMIQAAERKATRAQIKKLLPFEEMRAAMEAGYVEPWELAEYFEVTEDFVQEAINYYTGPCGLCFQKNLPDDCQS